MKNFSIRSYEDIVKIGDKALILFKDLGFPANGSLEFKVSEETFDKIGLYLKNRHITYLDYKLYNKMTLSYNNINITLIIN